ncbi:MAG: hypothetical protein JO356_09410 [Acidobacteria bacterium]|nr:hypothetical protein [Acidobacteriota bacterium]
MKNVLLLALTALVATCSATAPTVPQLRLTPTEILNGDKGESQIGSSKLVGVHTKILSGDPATAGFYSILLFVPPHTTIQAHSHRDDRMATVVSGTWHLDMETGSMKSSQDPPYKQRLFRAGWIESFCLYS